MAERRHDLPPMTLHGNRSCGGRSMIAAVLVLLAATAPTMAEDCAAPESGREHHVAEVVDGMTVALKDGRRIRLAGVHPPVSALDDPDHKARSRLAHVHLAGLLQGKTIRIAGVSNRADRHDRWSARLYRGGDNLWIDGKMIADGVLRVGAGPSPCRSALLKREADARKNARGLWGTSFKLLKAGDPDLANHAGRFAAVEGRIVSTGTGRRVVFLNFGKDWSADFTAIVTRPAGRSWRKAGFSPGKLSGQFVRIRGWLESRQGGYMRINEPAQIERMNTSTEGETRP